MKLTYKTTVTANVTHLVADMQVRYWEDGTVNGVVDSDGTLIPLRTDDIWNLKINLETGEISDWPGGTAARVHYKVCDAGEYWLMDEQGNEYARRDGYVPSMLSPGGKGFGDYVIMEIDAAGVIKNWQADLGFFETEDEY